MKKAIALFLFIALASPAFAAQRGTKEYEELKAYKKAQKEKKEQAKANTASHEKGFWQKEAERSGLAGTGAMIANSTTCLMPLDKPNSGKTK